MSNKEKKKKKLTKADLAPENFKTQEEHAQAVEDYYDQHPIYNYFQFFIGGTRIKKNTQRGKPGPPPY